MTTKYVNFATGNDTTGTGAVGAPWKTLYKAATITHSPGDVITFADGQYDETLKAVPVSAGTLAGGYITYKATNVTPTSRPVTFHYGTNISTTAKIQLDSVPYIWLEGLKFTQTTRGASNTPGDRPISVWTGSHYCVVKNCEVYEAVEPIKTYNNDYVTIDSCITHDSHWAGGSFASRFADWVGCEFYNFDSSGPQVGKGGARDCRIHSCLIRVTITADDAALWLGGISSAGSSQPDATLNEGYNNVAYSNIIFASSGGTIPYGIAFGGLKNGLAINNTIYAVAQARISSAAFHCRAGGLDWSTADGGLNYTTNPKFVNNIVHTATRGWQTNANGHKYSGTLTDNNNTIYNVASDSAPPASTTPTGSVSTLNKLTTDPLFVTLGATFAASNLRLQSTSPSKGTGVVTTHAGFYGADIPVNRDYTGVLRTGAWDRGAYADTVPEPPTGKSDYLEAALLNLIFSAVTLTLGTDIYFSLHNGDPADTGANEISLAGYNREAVTRNLTNFPSAVTAGVVKQKTNAVAIQFNTTTAGGTATHIGIWDALTGGNFLYGGPIVGAPITITSGTAIVIPAGSYSATEG